MLKAKSIYLGGELIDPNQATHQDTIDLGLVCPLCGKPLFLVQESSRTRKIQLKTGEFKESYEQIAAHFSHYKADPNAEQCEARSITPEGREFLSQLSSEARGQRLDLFNKRLWDMVAWNKDFPRNLEKWLNLHYPRYCEQLDLMVSHCWKHWKDPAERQEIKKAVPRSLQLLTEENFAASGIDVDRNKVLIQKAIEITKNELNVRLQWAIAEEVVDYLAQPHARSVFRKLVLLAMYDSVPNAALQGRAIHSNDIQYLVLSSIGLTDWKAALEHFKKPQAGEGFGTRKK